MNYYPLFLNLRGASCLVVGAGRVGRRKIESLLACDPKSLLVLDPSPALEMDGIHPALRYWQRAFQPQDVQGMHLVFACTPRREVNQAISAACRSEGILCNVADAPEEGNVIVPAVIRNGPLSLALSTSGASPALTRALKHDLEQWLDKGYAALVLLLEKLRPLVLSLHLGSERDADIFRALCAMPLREQLMEALVRRDISCCYALLTPMLPAPLHTCLMEILGDSDESA